MLPRTRFFALRSLIVLLAAAVAAPVAAQVETAEPEVDAAPTTPETPQTSDTGETIIVGPVNVYGFSPDERPNPEGLDVEALNFADLLHELGPQATLWYQHVMTLSNPFFEGRAPGTRGNELAAEYIAWYFRMYGLAPAFGLGMRSAEDAGAELAAVPVAPAPGGAPIDPEVLALYQQPFEVDVPGDDGEWTNTISPNVGGVLPGRGPLADEWLVIGAHYDHVGYGRWGANPGDIGRIHPGADDNASGTSAMLVLARELAEHYREAPEDASFRSILFLAFTAEELGLVGSRHFVQNSIVPAEDVMAMLNLDMVGRLRSDTLLVGGVGTAEGFLDLLRPHFDASGLTIRADPTGQGPSDHASFYGANLPVLFFFTGVHEVYHQPGDHAYTVNPVGAMKVIELVWDVALDLVTREERLTFTPAASPRRGPRVSLGVGIDFRAEVETGVLIDEVFQNSAAAKAGVEEGDVILAWDGEAIEGGRSLFRRLRDAEPGDEVTLTIQRGDATLEVPIVLEER